MPPSNTYEEVSSGVLSTPIVTRPRTPTLLSDMIQHITPTTSRTLKQKPILSTFRERISHLARRMSPRSLDMSDNMCSRSLYVSDNTMSDYSVNSTILDTSQHADASNISTNYDNISSMYNTSYRDHSTVAPTYYSDNSTPTNVHHHVYSRSTNGNSTATTTQRIGVHTKTTSHVLSNIRTLWGVLPECTTQRPSPKPSDLDLLTPTIVGSHVEPHLSRSVPGTYNSHPDTHDHQGSFRGVHSTPTTTVSRTPTLMAMAIGRLTTPTSNPVHRILPKDIGMSFDMCSSSQGVSSMHITPDSSVNSTLSDSPTYVTPVSILQTMMRIVLSMIHPIAVL